MHTESAIHTGPSHQGCRPLAVRELGPELIGSSDTVRTIAEEIECASRSDAQVLITGEDGVGKTVVAYLIHEQSRRRASSLLTIDCSRAGDTRQECELLECLQQADGGTLLIKEMSEMNLRVQALLLRFLENGEIQRAGSDRTPSVVDVRVISATSRNLLTRIAERRFRDDLYYRLNMFHIPIPPLRERTDDIAALFSSFLRSYCRQHGIPEPVVSEEILAALRTYHWPGNVRELRNAAERIALRSSATITHADLAKDIFPTV